jgi:hypothetical protein
MNRFVRRNPKKSIKETELHSLKRGVNAAEEEGELFSLLKEKIKLFTDSTTALYKTWELALVNPSFSSKMSRRMVILNSPA